MNGNGNKLNGGFKVAVGVILGLVTGALTVGIHYGGQQARLDSHIGDSARHETPEQKEHRIDDRVELWLQPILQQQREINRRLARIEEKLDE